jgi:hypothetical protein
MCTRFTTVRVNATGSSDDVGFEAARQCSGLVPGGMPTETTSPVGYWRVADIAVELADATVGVPTDERQLRVLTLDANAL